jgi:hypothetical protein
MRDRNYCYFHLTNIGRRLRTERAHARAKVVSPECAVVPLELPPCEDAASIQIALMQVVDAVLRNRIDTKRAGLVLYALQTASSNLANGASFAQQDGATVAAGYDDFEDDFELGDDVPELRAGDAEDPEADREIVDAAQAKDIVAACDKLESAIKNAEERDRIELNGDGSREFRCNPADEFLCTIMGARAHPPVAQADRRNEREAPSQRLEMLAVNAPAECDDGAAVKKEKAA